ncbi:MAG: sigma-70 family RNA polymerase sigma factor [Actinobacteria bacterium]|nr:MAG: sigma-70 family RNA polymerase sigma factor [Actinomycetota bacterium]
MEPDEAAFAEAWRDHRRYVLDVAYRMLGSVSDAEDVVQEAFARLLKQDPDQIQDVRGWLVVVATRLCLDQLRSARTKRESYAGPWLPEPVIDGETDDPADRITLDDSVRMAMLVVLERLTPAERATFVLHDVFGFSFEEVAKTVGRSVEACRQLASRARKRIEDETGPARFDVDPAEVGRLADRFISAATDGDMAALMDVLDPDVVGWTDSAGLFGAPLEPLAGRERVMDQLLRFVRGYGVTLSPLPVNGEPGVLVTRGGGLFAVIALETRAGRITRLHGIANPQKLRYVASVLGVDA